MMLHMTCAMQLAFPATNMFQKIVTSALIAGFGAGLLAAVLQFAFVQPVLLHAELFEGGDLVHFGSSVTLAQPDIAGDFDLVRNGLSIAFSALIYVGYALFLITTMIAAQERGHDLSVKAGLVWGVAGFGAVQMAPAFGLPPELPGMAAADVTDRQIWWFATVAATGIALWLIAFGKNWTMWGAAVILLAAPHIIGAPVPSTFTGPAPPELGAEFAARALGTGLVAWMTLGALTAYLWQSAPQEAS